MLGSQGGSAHLCCEKRSPLSVNLPQLKLSVTRLHSESLANVSSSDCFPGVILVGVAFVVVIVVVVVAVVFKALGSASSRKLLDG